MNEVIKRNQIIEYAERIITPAEVETAELITTVNDEHGESDIWLLSCDTGEEYWVIEGDSPADIYRKSGIYQTPERVYDAYIDTLETKNDSENLPDRTMYM